MILQITVVVVVWNLIVATYEYERVFSDDFADNGGGGGGVETWL